LRRRVPATGSTTRLRADAHRNREQIFAAAREAFPEQDVHAPLEEIACRAGVGIATLYRRFPDRRALVRQVVDLGERRHEKCGAGFHRSH
jgi:AcrR family transcriptional regulator